MSEEEKKYGQTREPENGGKVSFVYLYIAIGCFAAGCLLFALAFILPLAVKGVSVYLFIASMISSLAAVSFINAQTRKGKTKLCTIFKILSYAVMGAALIVVVIGMGLNVSAN